MKRNTRLTLSLSLLIVAAVSCGRTAPASPPTQTPDTQATVNAAIAATASAEQSIQATIDAATAATAAAMPTQPPSEPEAESPDSTVEYSTMTEEEMEALIDEAVTEATAATQQCSTAATDATADNTLTEEELAYVYDYYYLADEAIALAEELIYVYYDLYGELAYETIELLIAVEEDLSAMAESAEAIYVALEEASNTLDQGLDLAEETITKLNNAAQAASANVAEAQAQIQNLASTAQNERENRANEVLTLPPSQVPANRLETLQGAVDYLDLVRNSLADDKITFDELSVIAQLGANVTAGFQANGGPAFQGFSGSLNDITAQIARGQLPQARSGLGNFATSLGSIPGLPSKPSGTLPGGGLTRPSRP